MNGTRGSTSPALISLTPVLGFSGDREAVALIAVAGAIGAAIVILLPIRPSVDPKLERRILSLCVNFHLGRLLKSRGILRRPNQSIDNILNVRCTELTGKHVGAARKLGWIGQKFRQ
jgi:hypothetical protein